MSKRETKRDPPGLRDLKLTTALLIVFKTRCHDHNTRRHYYLSNI